MARNAQVSHMCLIYVGLGGQVEGSVQERVMASRLHAMGIGMETGDIPGDKSDLATLAAVLLVREVVDSKSGFCLGKR